MNNLKEIISNSIEQGGATLDKYYQPTNHKSGYMVSIANHETTLSINTDINTIINKVQEYQELIKNKQHYFIGLWVDNSTIYLHISKHFQDKQNAVNFGIDNDQLAIYDLKNDKSIYLTKKVYIIYELNKNNNDIKYIREFDTEKELKEYLNISNIQHYTTNNIDNIKHLANNKYFIFRDNVLINER